MGHIGPFEVGIVVVMILLFFGAKKLPEIGGAVAKAIKEFKKETRNDGKNDDGA